MSLESNFLRLSAKALMKRRKMTINDAAKEIGYARSAVSSWLDEKYQGSNVALETKVVDWLKAHNAFAQIVTGSDLPSPTQLRAVHNELNALISAEPLVPYALTEKGLTRLNLEEEVHRLKGIIARYAKGNQEQHALNVELAALCERQRAKLKALGVHCAN